MDLWCRECQAKANAKVELDIQASVDPQKVYNDDLELSAPPRPGNKYLYA